MTNQEELLLQSLNDLQATTEEPVAIDVNPSVNDTATGLSEAAVQMLLDKTNNTTFLGLSQPRPHVVEYVTQQLNIHEASNDTDMPTHGQVMPIKIPAKYTYPFDGYGFIQNGEHVWVKRSEIITWLFDNTLGFISEDERGRSLSIKAKKNTSASADTKSSPVTVARKGISLSDKTSFIETFEIDPTEGTTHKNVVLDGERIEVGGVLKTPRAKIEGYPVFKRKDDPEYDELGELNSKPKKGKKIRKGDAKSFLATYQQNLALHRQFLESQKQ